MRYSQRSGCPYCGTEPVSLSPALFSFNSAVGACPQCHGAGTVPQVDLRAVIPDDTKSIEDGAIVPWRQPHHRWALNELRLIAHKHRVPLRVPVKELTEAQRALVLKGETYYPGIYRFFDMLERKRHKPGVVEFLDLYRQNVQCQACEGGRLNPQALGVTIDGYTIAALCNEPLAGLGKRLSHLTLSNRQKSIAGGVLNHVVRRLDCLLRMGLGYLTLDREFSTLSDGETQRISFASLLAADLTGSLYALDEPTVGLHPTDRDRLFTALETIRDRGNTVIVIEHDRHLLSRADQILELGPGGGRNGGEVLFQGSYRKFLSTGSSLTAKHLSGRYRHFLPPVRRSPSGHVRVVGACKHNLRDLNVKIPLGMLVCLTGVSGSGKSVLLRDVLCAAFTGKNDVLPEERRGYAEVEDSGRIRHVVFADHSPISRSPRSIALSYIGLYGTTRAVFADVPLARLRGYRANHFSFNTKVGRCPGCRGLGYLEAAVSLVPAVRIKCLACGGSRFREEILEVRYRGKSIADILGMTADEAVKFFCDAPEIESGLNVVKEVGLGYMQLGQPLASLSRGEAQRLKLASSMVEGVGRNTLFLFDEPTAGLHFDDVVKLVECFRKLTEKGNSVVVAEHNMEFVKYADYVIDLGPGPGRRGGKVIARGTPERIVMSKASKTGAALKAYLNSARRTEQVALRASAKVETV